MGPYSSSDLADLYRDHNERRGRGFVFGGEQRIAALRAQLVGSCESVLDLGCRDGSLFQAMGINTSIAVGVDIDEEALRSIREPSSLRACRVDLSETLPFRSDSFNLVLAGEVLEHLPFPHFLVSEIARVLRPGGSFIGSVPNAYRLKNRLLFLLGKSYERDPTHLRQFSVPLLKELLGSHFESIKITPCVGRFVSVFRRLTANDFVWRAGLREASGHSS